VPARGADDAARAAVALAALAAVSQATHVSAPARAIATAAGRVTRITPSSPIATEDRALRAESRGSVNHLGPTGVDDTAPRRLCWRSLASHRGLSASWLQFD
jgi:hypothetical protein